MTEKAPRSKRVLSAVLVCVGTVLMVLATAVACIEVIAFDGAFYKTEYQKLDTAAYVGVGEEQLFTATDTLLEYLQGKRDTLDLQADIDGTEQEYYNEREKAHMVDVAVLNQNAIRFMIVGFIAGGCMIAAAWFVGKELSRLLKCCFFSILGVIAGFGVIGLWAAVDFNSFWVQFHHIFFTNDLWLLDEATSRMIRMFEQTFFFDMVTKILAWFLGIVIGMLVVTGIAYKRLEKKCKS